MNIASSSTARVDLDLDSILEAASLKNLVLTYVRGNRILRRISSSVGILNTATLIFKISRIMENENLDKVTVNRINKQSDKK